MIYRFIESVTFAHIAETYRLQAFRCIFIYLYIYLKLRIAKRHEHFRVHIYLFHITLPIATGLSTFSDCLFLQGLPLQSEVKLPPATARKLSF